MVIRGRGSGNEGSGVVVLSTVMEVRIVIGMMGEWREW